MFGFKTNKDRLIQRLQAENAVLKRHIDILKEEVEYEKSTIVQVKWNKEPDIKIEPRDNVVPITSAHLSHP